MLIYCAKDIKLSLFKNIYTNSIFSVSLKECRVEEANANSLQYNE